MSEISKVDLLKIESKLQARKNTKSQSNVDSKFEAQLLKTVKKLENMGNEINEMIESNALQIKPNENLALKPRKEVFRNFDSTVENISAAGKSSIKSARAVASEYESMSPKKSSKMSD